MRWMVAACGIGLLLAACAHAQEPIDVDAFLARLRAPEELTQLKEFRVYDHPGSASIDALAVSADSKRIAGVGGGSGLAVWEAGSGKVLLNTSAPGGGLAISADGKLVVAGQRVIEVDTGKVLFTHEAPKGEIGNSAISPDNKWVVFVTRAGIVHRYPLLGGKGGESSLKDHDGRPTHSAISADASRALVFASDPYQALAYFLFQGEDTEPWTRTLRSPVPRIASVLATDELMIVAMGSRILYFEQPAPDKTMLAFSASGAHAGYQGVVSRDGRWMATTDRQRILELRSLETPAFSRLLQFQDGEPEWFVDGMALVPASRVVLIGTTKGKVRAYRVPEGPINKAQYAALTLKQLLREERYAELDMIISKLERDPQPFAWNPNRTPLEALGVLIGSDLGRPAEISTVEKQLDGWIANRPDAKFPRLRRAERFITVAWQHRGGGVAAQVTPEGWQGFHENIAKARELAEPVAAEQKPIPMAYRTLAIISMAENWDREQRDEYFDRLIEEAPGCIEAHASFMQGLMPRWGGAPEDCHDYATRVADKIGGADGDAMYARLAIEQRLYYPEEHFLQMAGLDAERTLRGLLHLARTAPDRHWAQHTGLRLAYNLKDHAQAKAFADLLNTSALRHQWQAGWWSSSSDLRDALKFVANEAKTSGQ